MATYNLAVQNETQLDKRFSAGSYTDAWTNKQFSFEGVNAIKLWTLGKANINDYTLTPATGVSRFGAIHEVEDEQNTYTLRNKKSFNESFDETNVQDQMFIKKAQAYLAQVWDEQFVPLIDQYRMGSWCNGAGNVVINATSLTNSTIIRAMLTANAALDNKLVPRKGRAFFVPTTVAIEMKLASELAHSDTFTNKAIINGLVNIIDGTPVVAMPDFLFPTGVQFVLKYKMASVDPMKLKLLRAITTSENVAGTLMQGLVRYDSFVLAQKAYGIYVYMQSGAVATPTGDNGATASGKVTLTTATSSGVIHYTVDGSNPKTSDTAEVYSAAFTSPAAGSVVRAYASKTGLVNSGIFELSI